MNHFRTILKKIHAGAHIDPSRDWLVLLGFAAIMFAAVVVWNIWAFDTVANGGVIGTPTVPQESVFSRSSLDTIHAVFERRQAEEMNYVTGTYRFSDPSQ